MPEFISRLSCGRVKWVMFDRSRVILGRRIELNVLNREASVAGKYIHLKTGGVTAATSSA